MPEQAIRIDFETWTEINDYQKREAAHEKLRAELALVLEALEKHPKSPSYLSYYRLTPASCTALAALLADLAKRKRAKVGCCQIYEWADTAVDAEWYELAPDVEFNLDGRAEGITRVKADRIKGREPVRGYSHNVFVTEPVRDALVKAKLAAFETFWVADTGKYAATQWYHLVPKAFVGRGVDHPWFDVKTRGRFKRDRVEEVQPTDDPWRGGANVFELRQLRNDPPGAAPELKRLLGVLRDTPLIDHKHANNYVDAPVRLLRRFLPTGADIGYTWQAKPFGQGHDPCRAARVCVSRKARGFLLERRMAREADFQPLVVLDKPPAGAEVFDGSQAPPAPPIYPPEAVTKMRAAEAKLRAKFDAKPRPEAPVKPVPLKPLLAKLKREVTKRGNDVNPGAAAAAVKAAGKGAGIAVPARWAEVLAAVDGFVLDQCALFDGEGALRGWSSGELAANHKSTAGTIRLGWPDMAKGYLAVADNDFGDPIFLDTAKSTADGDCPVAWVDHETSEVVQTWPSVTLFLKDAIEPPDED